MGVPVFQFIFGKFKNNFFNNNLFYFVSECQAEPFFTEYHFILQKSTIDKMKK